MECKEKLFVSKWGFIAKTCWEEMKQGKVEDYGY
jgi:hypothetical protein